MDVRFGEWIRSGDCNRCGSCCKGNPLAGGDDAHPPLVAGYCPIFRHVDGVATCSDREHPYYLQGCNVFPSHPGQIIDHPECSYTFRPAEAD